MQERAILAGLELKGRAGTRPASAADQEDYSPEESLQELGTLARSAGAEVVEQMLQSRDRAEADTLIGHGKVDELSRDVVACAADVVIFDRELTPTQQRNLERAVDCRVIDRTQLILDIFARRARTREGQLQVELAQLNYLLPRLAGRGTQMSRLGGGIGTRGPGETQLETDRRKIAGRIRKIESDLEGVRASRSVQRRQRQEVPLATASLVGYTNAGKSTLFNRLTGAGVTADARMFATLDPTVRAIALPSNRRILLSDTVGFIRSLPITLVEAFRATLEEVSEAALILHCVDVSSPHARQQIAHVQKVLEEIGAGSTRQVLVLNKIDSLPAGTADAEAMLGRVAGAKGGPARAVAVSARTGEGVEKLLDTVDEVIPFDPVATTVFRFPLTEGSKISQLYDFGRVQARRDEPDYCEITADVSESLRNRFSNYVVRTEAAG